MNSFRKALAHYENNNTLYFERFGKNYDIRIIKRDGSIVIYNLERVKRGYLSLPKYFSFDGHSVIRAYDNKIVETGF
jgi:hypothetical protein